ncbi:MAG: prepilin-type N-terminal cleavage/methylation domain-containing protein [Magnetococcales bacterium]|nr:prepilin-type N-terminal cleavage/methylation domain-containing protein [Magnetococcales bacterium]
MDGSEEPDRTGWFFDWPPVGGRGSCSGFTLLEMAMVLLILGLLLGGMLGPLSQRQEVNRRQEGEALLREVHDTLMGFVMTHGYFPCPDGDGDGREDRKDMGCDGSMVIAGDVFLGQLPHVTLGVGRMDPWNNRLRYAVDAAFVDGGTSPLPPFSGKDRGRIAVTNGIDQTPVVVVSHGGNGLGAVNAVNLLQGPATSLSERENSDRDARFVLDEYREDPEHAFDDLLTWISPNLLALRMTQVGKPLR